MKEIELDLKKRNDLGYLEMQTHDVVVHVKAIANIKFKFEFFDEALF